MYDIIQIIDTINTAIKPFRYINYGGCGVAAERMYTRLTELGFEPTIVCSYGSWEEPLDLDDLRMSIECSGKSPLRYENWVNANGINTVSFNHVILKVGYIYFDAENVLDVDCGRVSGYGHLMEGSLTIDELRMFNKANIWNTTFKRNHNPARIRSTITRTIRKFNQPVHIPT